MTLDRTLCPICAWRRDCKKKFSRGEGVHCPDFTKDLSIKTQENELIPPKTETPKKRSKKSHRSIFKS